MQRCTFGLVTQRSQIMWLELSHLESPPGEIGLAAGDQGLCAVEFVDASAPLQARLERKYPGARFRPATGGNDASRRLRAYFAGEADALENVAVAPIGTPFQQT